jgi:ATP-dependent DNA helicase RecG
MSEIVQMLAMPEGKTLEFKQDLTSLQPILKTLIAFANTAGGCLIIGIDNDGKILGVENVFQEEERLASSIADSIYPFLMSEITIASIDGKSLLVVSVAHWKGPFYLKAKGPIDGVFVRLGSTNRSAGPELLEELKRCGTYTSFDQTPCREVDASGLNQEQIQRAFAEIGRKINEAELLSLGILIHEPHSKKNVCSQGGILLFGNSDVRNRYFPGSVIRCARFSGTEKIDFIDQYDIDRTLVDAMEEILKFIRRNTRLSAKVRETLREEISEYSPVVIREIVINALVHADYSLKGMHLRISIFDDRLEIESPGMLPLGYTLDDFRSGISHVRNKVIARTFRELHRMEEWGTGYRRIVEACRKGGYPIPDWEEIGMTLRATLYPYAAFLSEKENTPSLRQQKILSILQESNSLTAKEIHFRLNEDISERGLRADLLELKKIGLIAIQGKGPSSVWIKL